MAWPDFFPENCPPDNAEPASGEVYRFTDTNPPSPKDFKSHRELFPSRRFTAPEWKACGVSVYKDHADVELIKLRVPRLRKLNVAQGSLNPSLGVMLQTPTLSGDEKSHHTWWIPVGAEPWNVFYVIQTAEM